jgi:hypothetical protein
MMMMMMDLPPRRNAVPQAITGASGNAVSLTFIVNRHYCEFKKK